MAFFCGFVPGLQVNASNGAVVKVVTTSGETIPINPDGLGQVTISCESGSSVEINFNTKHFHFHQATFDTDQIYEIINGG